MLIEKLRWGVEQRLAFIESQVFWEGAVNRADLMATFDISVPQASKDLSLYQEQAPGNLRYDGAKKRYVATANFAPRFAKLDPDAYLRGLSEAQEEGNAAPGALQVERLPIPLRQIDPKVLRRLAEAVRQGSSLEILYQFPEAAPLDEAWRRVSPHAFAHDGVRWHVRAYCHREERFRDFIVSRCIEAGALGALGMSSAEDYFWNDHFAVVLRPNPRLTAAEQLVVQSDYGMTHGVVAIPVRRALLYHFNKRMRLDLADDVANPREAPVIVKNRADYERALSAAYSWTSSPPAA